MTNLPPSDPTPGSPEPYGSPVYGAAAAPAKRGLSLAGFILGIASLVFWLFPFLGFPVSIVGLILSIVARTREPGSPKWMKTLGLIFSIIGLVLTIVSAIIGAVNAVNVYNQLNN